MRPMVRLGSGIALLVLAWTGLAAVDAEAFRALANAELHSDRVTAFGFTFRDVTGKPVLDGDHLRIPDVAARFAGGTATCVLDLDFPGDLLVLAVDVRNVDLATFLSEMGGGADGVSGIASGHFDFRIPLHDPHNDISGTVTVTNGDLLRLGPLSSLLLGDLNAPAGSDRAEGQVILEHGRLRLRGARIVSPGAVVHLLGTIGLDGSLDIIAVPYPEFTLLQIIPGIGDVAAWLLSSTSSRLARARIRGTLGNPAVTVAPFATE